MGGSEAFEGGGDGKSSRINPRVARALNLRNQGPVLPVPPLPSGSPTQEEICLWLDQVILGMHPDSHYRHELMKVLKRFGNPQRKAKN